MFNTHTFALGEGRQNYSSFMVGQTVQQFLFCFVKKTGKRRALKVCFVILELGTIDSVMRGRNIPKAFA